MDNLFKTDRVFSSLVNEIANSINEEVIITNEEGIIVASTDKERIDNYHEGAYLAMKNQKKMIMTEELTNQLQGVRKGIVLPIIIEKKPIGVIGLTGDPPTIEPYARIVQRMSELFIKETTDQMSQERMALNLEHFIFDWIHNSISLDLLIERSEFLNIDLSKYKQVISLHTVSTMNNLTYKEIHRLKEMWDNNQNALFIRWGQEKIIIIDIGYESNVLYNKITQFIRHSETILGNKVFVGVGQQHNYENLSKSYEQSERAAIIAKKEKRIIFEDQLRFEMLQYGLQKDIKKQFINRTISPLLEEKHLLETLNSWLDNNMSIQKTAEALYIHKNTLYYRLQKMESLTNLDINNVDHVVLLYVALKFNVELSDYV